MFKNGVNGKEIPGNDELNDEQEGNELKMKKPNRFFQALSLPTLCKMNPRSVYNKSEEFHTLVKEEELDVIFISESWEREYLPLDRLINLEDHTVISNVSQRVGVGGRPAIVANKTKFYFQNSLPLFEDSISPWYILFEDSISPSKILFGDSTSLCKILFGDRKNM